MAGFLARMMGGGDGNYAYVTARVRAKKAKLVPREEYERLLQREASEIARTLQEGQYKTDIDALASRYRGAELVERATRAHVGRIYAEILGFASGELRAMIGTYLGRYDVYNVKTILRGKFARARPEEILNETIPAGALASRLEELARLERIDDVVSALAGTPWHRPLARATEGRQLSSLLDVENTLDRAYYDMLIATIPTEGLATRAFLDWVRNEIDILNIKTLFRLRFAGVTEWEPYFVDGGREVGRDTAQRLVRGSDDEVVQEISQLSLAAEVTDATRKSLAARNVSAVASALDRELLRDAHDFSHRAPLSILPVIDYILRKKTESDNLRAIAYGKQTGLPTETLQELLVL